MLFRFSLLLLLAVIPSAFNQFITFKDGKFGVNFAGYHAEAGLGGLLTGNAAHGGLSASAGTPFGQRAGAGIGGTVDNGRTAGGAFAGASAGYGVGAGAAIGGNVDEYGGAGGLGSEAHAAGISTKTVKLSQTPHQPQQFDQRSSFAFDIPEQPASKRYYKRKEVRRNNRGKDKTVEVESRFEPPQAPPSNFDYRNFLDFGFFSNAAATFSGAPHPATQRGGQVLSLEKQISPNTVLLHKTVLSQPIFQRDSPKVNVDERIKEDDDEDFISSEEQSSEEEVKPMTKVKSRAASSAVNSNSGSTTFTATKQIQPNPNFFNDIFNIPISTLGAVSQFLSNSASGGVSVTKTATAEVKH